MLFLTTKTNLIGNLKDNLDIEKGRKYYIFALFIRMFYKYYFVGNASNNSNSKIKLLLGGITPPAP